MKDKVAPGRYLGPSEKKVLDKYKMLPDDSKKLPNAME